MIDRRTFMKSRPLAARAARPARAPTRRPVRFLAGRLGRDGVPAGADACHQNLPVLSAQRRRERPAAFPPSNMLARAVHGSSARWERVVPVAFLLMRITHCNDWRIRFLCRMTGPRRRTPRDAPTSSAPVTPALLFCCLDLTEVGGVAFASSCDSVVVLYRVSAS